MFDQGTCHSLYGARYVAALLLAFLPVSADAQAPSPQLSDIHFEEAGALDSDSQAVRDRIDRLREEIESLPEGGDPELRDVLVLTKAAAGFHLDALEAARIAQAALEAARRETSDWHGFAEGPPYSVLLQDELRDKLVWCDDTERGLRSLIVGFQKDLERLQTELRAHSQAERRNREAAERASGTAAAPALEREAALANAYARLTRERAARHEIRLGIMRTRLAELAEIRELTQRKLASIGDDVAFSKEELDGVLQRIGEERLDLAGTRDALSGAVGDYDALNNWMSEYFAASITFWETRYAIQQASADEIPEHAATLKEILSNLANWSAIVDTAITGTDSGFGDINPEKLRDMASRLRGMQRLVERTLGDIGHQRAPGSKAMMSRVREKALGIWNAELYLAEENEIVDGRKIPVYRPVTTAKLVWLLVILLAGWIILRVLVAWMLRAITRRGKMPPATAALVGKWVSAAGLLVLLLYGMHSVRIPLTVFAFLGGALAIGIGFGTQTLLKNFISGIILLLERPLKVGDVVEVAGITGTIKQVGIRASLITHFDGIDTLIPNSLLLENQLTNWTYSDTILRGQIQVGVAYGSSTREVARLLVKAAASHGLVVKDPKPYVRFDNFGDDSLLFTLLYWSDTCKIGRLDLASDLRFMIDKSFAEAGIVISYPQRDVHLDAKQPLRVELAGPKAPSPEPPRSEPSAT